MNKGKGKILLADDEERMRRLLCDYLKKELLKIMRAPLIKNVLNGSYYNCQDAKNQ